MGPPRQLRLFDLLRRPQPEPAAASERKRRRPRLRSRGRSVDLSPLAEELNRRYFGGALTAAITWGRRRPHTPEFRRRERLYPRLNEANAWIRENLRRLIAVG